MMFVYLLLDPSATVCVQGVKTFEALSVHPVLVEEFPPNKGGISAVVLLRRFPSPDDELIPAHDAPRAAITPQMASIIISLPPLNAAFRWWWYFLLKFLMSYFPKGSQSG